MDWLVRYWWLALVIYCFCGVLTGVIRSLVPYIVGRDPRRGRQVRWRIVLFLDVPAAIVAVLVIAWLIGRFG